MSDWVKQEWANWTDKIIYLEKVTGQQIIEEYNKMNLSGTKHIIATQIFPIQTLPPEPMLFNVFIYYKDKHGNVKM